MPYPKNDPKTEVCVVASRDGVTIYGNAAAFRTLAKWMSWIAKSDESEHYECHVGWHLRKHYARSPNVSVLFDATMSRAVAKRSERTGVPFEVTFMAVTKRDVVSLRKNGQHGVLPEEWFAKSAVVSSPATGTRKGTRAERNNGTARGRRGTERIR
jgi:hypothetical protein